MEAENVLLLLTAFHSDKLVRVHPFVLRKLLQLTDSTFWKKPAGELTCPSKYVNMCCTFKERVVAHLDIRDVQVCVSFRRILYSFTG